LTKLIKASTARRRICWALSVMGFVDMPSLTDDLRATWWSGIERL
jgi:hypothetical protein